MQQYTTQFEVDTCIHLTLQVAYLAIIATIMVPYQAKVVCTNLSTCRRYATTITLQVSRQKAWHDLRCAVTMVDHDTCWERQSQFTLAYA